MNAQDTSQENILDLAKLNETFMGDTEIIKQILCAFQEAVVSFEDEFKQAEGERDKEAMSRLVHSLKGSSANIRAEKVSKEAAHAQGLIDRDQHYNEAMAELFRSVSQLVSQINVITNT